MGLNREGINPELLTDRQHVARGRGVEVEDYGPGRVGIPEYDVNLCQYREHPGCSEPASMQLVAQSGAPRLCLAHYARVLADVESVQARGPRRIQL